MASATPAGAAGGTPAPERLALVRQQADADHRVVFCTARRDGSIQATVVTAGVMDHPLDGQPVVAFTARGGTVKLANLRRRPQGTVTFRAGRDWVTVEGRVDLIGPDDPRDGFPMANLPGLLRDVFRAAGGTHDNWPAYDRVMAEEHRAAVFVHLDRVYTNPRR